MEISPEASPKLVEPKRKQSWFRITPGSLVVLLLVVEAVLPLSERFQWFSFNEKKGWTVVFGVTAVALFFFLMFIWFIVSLFLHRRFQFSIRSLLLLTVAVAVPFSSLAVELKKSKEQQKAVEAITKLGGQVGYGYDIVINNQLVPWTEPPSPALRKLLGDDFFSDVTSVLLSSSKATDADLEHLGRLKNLRYLDISQTMISDAGLVHIEGLMQLKTLDFHLTQVTDIGLKHLIQLNELKNLNLSNTQITDTGLESIGLLTKLKDLDLSWTQITGVGLKHFIALSHLQKLCLSHTKIAGAGLEQLKGLEELQILYLSGTQIGDEGLQYIKGLDHLIKLNLDQTPITDAGLKYLSGLTQLTQLNLAKTQISDDGLIRLEGLKQLKGINLEKTRVTQSGVSRLVSKLHDVMIGHDRFE